MPAVGRCVTEFELRLGYGFVRGADEYIKIVRVEVYIPWKRVVRQLSVLSSLTWPN
jgi:hypothetical protein